MPVKPQVSSNVDPSLTSRSDNDSVNSGVCCFRSPSPGRNREDMADQYYDLRGLIFIGDNSCNFRTHSRHLAAKKTFVHSSTGWGRD